MIICRFLLVSLNIEAILGEVTIGGRRKKLEEMARGNGLSDAYTTTLTRLKGQKGNKSVLGLKVLMWVLYSERPLQVDELRYALAVEMGSLELDPKNVPVLRTLLSSCLGLVTVEGSSSTVRLVHFTLQEHLLSFPTLFHSPHSTIAEVCLTYLNFGCIRDLQPTLDSYLPMPLLEYASLYWGNHTRMGMTGNVKILALRLLDRFDEHISTQRLVLRYLNQDETMSRSGIIVMRVSGFTGLHGVAFFGIVDILAALLEMKEWDANAEDFMGTTALAWAAIKGHEEVVKMLLERKDVNPSQAGTLYSRTPLAWAARGGHEGIVRMLLEREEVNPDQADARYGQTPLLLAAERGHEGIVKLLLGREEVNPDQVDEYGRTPLSWAAACGHAGVVKMLLEREEVNPDQADSNGGRTPLSWAAGSGHKGIVRMLLEREDVNPGQSGTKYGKTPVWWAAEGGQEEVVKILLEREEVNPNQADTEHGRTPLSWAAGWGHAGVVKMLMKREGVNPDQADAKYGRTPLSWAAGCGREGVVKMLLEREEVNPDQADTKYGQTPLSWAAKKGHEGVVKVLLEREEANPSRADAKYG